MSVLSAATRSPRGTLGDLAVMWVALFGAFAYLDVPLRNAPLFAVALVLQASLGMFVITRLLDGLQPSLLLLCGPGLILGGALSFAVFQLSGRGAVGAVTTALVGVVAAAILIKRDTQNDDSPQLWTVGQLFGLAATAMVVEFSELLPLAVLFFAIGFATSPERAKSRWVFGLSATFVVITIAVTSATRQDYWWLVTDDYQFFEVMARHITVSGLLVDWGVTSFLRYHWLSYGWSGLLDFMGGSPAPFVTLTRVMPLVYSASLAASLMLIRERVSRQLFSFSNLLPVWFVVSLAGLDWSGTSTAGVYAALAALLFVLMFLIDDRKVQLRGLSLLVIFALIILLTKMPSVFSVLTLLLGSLVVMVSSQFTRADVRATSLVLGGVATVSITLLLVWLTGLYFGWRLNLISSNYGLGQISESGRFFSAIALVVLRLPLWAIVVPLAVHGWKMTGSATNGRLPNSSLIVTLMLLGLLLELGIFARVNTSLYLAGPQYFLASLAIITRRDVIVARGQDREGNRLTLLSMTVILAFGPLWALGGNQRFWDLVDQHAAFLSDLQITILRFVTEDSRVGAAVAASLIALTFQALRKAIPISQILLLPTIVLTFSNWFWPSINDFETETPSEITTAYLGSKGSQEIGARLRQVSHESDLIATNHLFDTEGALLSDFSLAAWSGREFLILGPRFAGEILGRRAEATNISMQFADTPTIENCQALQAADVKWFVVDLRLTDSRDWSACAEQDMSVENFTLLKMRFPEITSN